MLDERTRRITAANEAMAWGAGGISAVSRACGLSRQVVRRGIEDLTEGRALPTGRIRQLGGGRKRITVTDPAGAALEAMVADGAWRSIAAALDVQEHVRWQDDDPSSPSVSHAKVVVRGRGTMPSED